MSDIIPSKEIERIESNKKDFKTEHIEKEGYRYIDYFEFPSEISEEDLINQDRIFKSKQEVVLNVLEGYELSRNYDTVLELECLRTEFPCIEVTSGKDNIIFKFPRKFIRAILKTPFEDYRRARQKLISDAIKQDNQEQLKLLLPTIPEIRARRINKQKILREYFRSMR